VRSSFATPAYALRLRECHQVELARAKDAQARGWLRERHLAMAARIEQLLTDLGERLGDPTAADRQ
jgi:hypothetical protein